MGINLSFKVIFIYMLFSNWECCYCLEETESVMLMMQRIQEQLNVLEEGFQNITRHQEHTVLKVLEGFKEEMFKEGEDRLVNHLSGLETKFENMQNQTITEIEERISSRMNKLEEKLGNIEDNFVTNTDLNMISRLTTIEAEFIDDDHILTDHPEKHNEMDSKEKTLNSLLHLATVTNKKVSSMENLLENCIAGNPSLKKHAERHIEKKLNESLEYLATRISQEINNMTGIVLKTMNKQENQIERAEYSIPEPSCEEDGFTHSYEGSCYYISHEHKPWVKARNTCHDMLSDLVKIETYEELQFLGDLIRDWTWIGLSDQQINGQYLWSVDGTVQSIFSIISWFFENEPNNNVQENCISMIKFSEEDGSKLADDECTYEFGFVCERNSTAV